MIIHYKNSPKVKEEPVAIFLCKSFGQLKGCWYSYKRQSSSVFRAFLHLHFQTPSVHLTEVRLKATMLHFPRTVNNNLVRMKT